MTAPAPGGAPGFEAIGQPAVQPGPVQTGWEFFLVPTGPSDQVVMVRISTPVGMICLFATGPEMADIARKMLSSAEQCMTRLVLPPPKDLFLPPSVNGHDHRPPGAD